VYVEVCGDADLEEEELLVLVLRVALGRTTTSWGWLEDLRGMRVIVGPVGRWRVWLCLRLSLEGEEEVLLLRAEQSEWFLLPHLAHGWLSW
jgi:hypothetical protein